MTPSARVPIDGRRALLPLALLLLCACGSSERHWVAEVDGQVVSLEELQRAVALRAQSEPRANSEDLYHEELQRMIGERIVLNRAAEASVEVRDAEVDERISELVGGDAAAAAEVSSKAYREALRRQMLIDRTAVLDLAGQVQISESAMVHYFEENRDRFRKPARVRIRQVVVRDEAKAHSLLQELRGGADFSRIAHEHSVAPEAEVGGLLPPFAKGEMPEEFDAAFRLRTGQLSRVIASPFGFHVFRLEEKIPAWEPTLEDVRAEVRSELEQARLQSLRREWLRELRRTAQVRVNEQLLETLQ